MKGKPENRLLGHHFYNRPLDNNVVIIAIMDGFSLRDPLKKLELLNSFHP